MSNDKRQCWLSREEFQWITAMRNAKKCAEKRPFESKALALREIWRMMNNGTPPANRLKAYECPSCGLWHLTKKA